MRTTFYRLLSTVLFILTLGISVMSPACAYADDAITPTLYLTHAPAYGSKDCLLGKVQLPDDAAFDPKAYRVTAYVEVPPYGCYVKPLDSKPYVDLLADGSFELKYDSGGENDRKAPYLHVFLIPADYTPGLRDLAGTQAVVKLFNARIHGIGAVLPLKQDGQRNLVNMKLLQ